MDGRPPSTGALGRTEDVTFTGDGRWLLAAGYAYEAIWAFEVLSTRGPLLLGPPRRLTSPLLAGPHGVAAIGRVRRGSLLVVANRARTLSFHVLTDDGRLIDIDVDMPCHNLPSEAKAPSVLCVAPRRGDTIDLYSCSNDVPILRCTTLRLGSSTTDDEPLEITDDRAIELPLVAVPDGLAVSSDGRWLALSNHRYHRVNLYDLDQPIVADRTPDGIVRGIAFPHGVRFAPGSAATLLVADAGAPYVHVVDGRDGWHGLHRIARSLRIMDQETFEAGHHNPQEGGPKGLDVTADGSTFVITSHTQPIAAFAVPVMGNRPTAPDRDDDVDAWSADLERREFEEWFATGVTNAWLENEIRMLREIVEAWHATKLVRWTRPFRVVYARLLRRPIPPR